MEIRVERLTEDNFIPIHWITLSGIRLSRSVGEMWMEIGFFCLFHL